MNYTKNDVRTKTHENTTESGYGEMIYMEPGPNAVMSPVITEGRQTLGPRGSSPEGLSKNKISTVKVDLREQSPQGDRPIKSLVVAIPSRGTSEEMMERSPKVINFGDSSGEYNIRTTNVRRSPKGGIYQTFTNIEQGNIAMDQPIQYSGFQPMDNMYQMGNDSNIMMGSQNRQSPQGSISYTMNPREGRDPMIRGMSPNNQNIDEINSSVDKSFEPQVQLNNLKNVLGNSVRMPIHYQNDNLTMGNMGMNMNMTDVLPSQTMNNNRMIQTSEIKYNNATYNNMTMGDVKNLVKRFTKVYDPKKTKEGTLINENQIIIPGANDDVFKGRYRVLQKMNRLSNILLSKRVEYSPEREERSFEEQRRTFDRHTLNKSTLQKKRFTVSRSPENKFLYLSLAMLSSKGPNTEDRIILRRMRFEKGGVVDLAQEKRKKGEKVVIKNARQAAKIRGRSFINTNPKFREKAAKLIQAWWRELKEIYNERLNMIIKIQSFWRGRWVRKYMYDILYLSFMYQSFCQIIQKVLVKHVRPYVFYKLTEEQKKSKNLLKNLLLKTNRWNMLRIKPYLDRWVNYIRKFQVRNNKGRQLFDIRNNNEQKKNKLIKYFDKWSLLTKLFNNANNADIANREKNKYIGANKIIDGLKKLTKRNAFKSTKTKILEHLKKEAKNKALKNLVTNKKFDNNKLKKYFDRWKKKEDNVKVASLKRKISTKILTNEINKIEKDQLKDAFHAIVRSNPKPNVIEKIIVQERIIEKEAKEKSFNNSFFKGAEMLEKAIFRLTFKYPLDAIDDKINGENMTDKLLRLIKIREKVYKYILKKYFNKWTHRTDKKGDKNIMNSFIARLMINYANKLKNRILNKKLNQWKNNSIPKITEEDTIKKIKKLDDFSRTLSKQSTKNFGKEFIENLKSTKPVPRVFQKALKKIIDNYFNKDTNKLRHYLYKWKDQTRKMEIYDLKLKYLLAIGGRNDLNNKKLRLGRAVHKWLMNLKENQIVTKIHQTTLKDNNKNIAALLIKSLKRNLLKNDKDSILRKALRTWLKKIGNIQKVYNNSIKEAIDHLLRANILKNGRDLLHNNKGKIVLISKKRELKNLLPYRRRYELILLLHYLLKWKNQMLAKRAAATHRAYRKNFLNSMFSKKDKERLIRAIYKWKGNCKSKINHIPTLYGLKQLTKTLCKDAFEKIKNTPSKKPVDIEYIKKSGKTVTQALMEGDINMARVIALRKIFLMNYLNKWRKNIKREISAEQDEEKKEVKNIQVKKFLKGPILRISKIPLRKYFNKWRDNVKDISNIDIQRIIYMKLVKNIYDKYLKDVMRKNLFKWKNSIYKTNKNLLDGRKAINLLRKIITQPIFDVLKTKITEIEKTEKKKEDISKTLRNLFIHRNTNKNKIDLSKYLNKWKQVLSGDNETKIKTSLLVNLASSQNRKKNDNAINRLREVLLKWRIKISPQESVSLDKIKKLREGMETLNNVLKRPHSQNIFNEIKNRTKRVGGSKILSKIITKITPKVKNNILRKYFNKWKERLHDDIKIVKKINKLVENVFTNPDILEKLRLKKNKTNPYKDLPYILKELYKNKVNKAQKIIDFFRSIKPRKNDKIEIRNKKLNLIIKRKDDSLKLRHYFFKWIRIARMQKAFEDALIIRKFCKIKVKHVNKKKVNIEEFVEILKCYILKIIFDKLHIGGKKKRNTTVLLKIISKNEMTNKKNLKEAFLKWKNLIPVLKKIDAATKIQSTLRGLKTRKTKQNYNKSLNNLKLLYLKKDTNNIDYLRSYLMKWLLNSKRIQTDIYLKKIQKFLKEKKVHYTVKIQTNKLKDFFRRLLIKFIISGFKHITKTHKDNKNFDELLNTLIKIFTKKSFDDLTMKMQNKNRLISLSKIIPKIRDILKHYFIPLYLKKWKEIAIDKRDEKTEIIQNFLRSKKRQKTLTIKKVRKQKLTVNLEKFVKKKSEINDDILRRFLKIWFSKSRKTLLNELAKKIQKFMHKQKSKKQEVKKVSNNKIKSLFIKYIINQIKEVLQESNKITNKFEEALNKIMGIDKRYMTNNLLLFAHDKIKREVLLDVFNSNIKRDNKELLRRYLLKWRDHKDYYLDRVKRLQKFFRKTHHLKKQQIIIKTHDKLLSIFIKHDENLREIKRSIFRKWQLRNQLIKCNDSSMIIQEFILSRLFKVLRDKITHFFVHLSKKIIERKLNQLAKFRNLRKALIHTYLKRVIKKSQDNHNKDIITNTLKKTLESKHFKIKDIYLRNILRDWLRRSKEITNQFNNAATKIQNLFKTKKSRKEVEKKKSGYNSLKNIVNVKIIPKNPKNPIRIYLWKWLTNTKKLGAIEMSNKIKKMFKKVKKVVNNQKKEKNDKNIVNGVDILNKYNPNKKYAFDLFKKYVKMILLNSILNNLKENRKKNIEDFIKKLQSNAKEKKLNGLINVNNNLWKQLIKNAIKKWKEKKEEIKKDEEKKEEEQKKEEEKKQKKTNNLTSFVKKKDENNKNILDVALKVWKRNAAQIKLENASQKLKKYLSNKLKNLKTKNNWKKLFDLLKDKKNKKDKRNILGKLLLNGALDILSKTLRSKSRKETLNDVNRKTKKIKKMKTLDSALNKANDKNSNFLLRQYLNKWLNIKKRINQKENATSKLIEELDKINKRNAINLLNAAFLIKKLLHDIPYIRALDFMKKLKEKYEMKMKLNALKNSLIKTKKDLDTQNKSNFIKSLYKLYLTRAIEKMMKKLKEMENLNKLKHGKIFLKNLKHVHYKKLEYREKMRKDGSNDSKKTTLQFKAHISSKKSKIMDEENKSTIIYIIPHLINWLNKKIKERKKNAFKSIINEDKHRKFIKYMEDNVYKKMKKPKNDFLNILKNIQHISKTKGPLTNKLYELLRKYIIRKWMSELNPMSRGYKLFYLFKLLYMFKGVSQNRYIREIIRKWRFVSFSKIMAKRKLELMYKDLHVSYLQMANEFFGEEDNINSRTLIKEFEEFGNGIGIWGNENPKRIPEASFCQKVNRKYVFDPVEVQNVDGIYPEIQKLYTETNEIKSQLITPMKSAQKGKSSKKKNNYYNQLNNDDDDLNNNVYLQDMRFGASAVSGISSHSGSRRTPKRKDRDSEDIKDSGKKFFGNNFDDLDYSSKNNSVYEERKDEDSDKKGSYKVKERTNGKK